MYLFNKTEKANILSGRTITYVANKIGVTPTFLTSVFNGKRTCSKTVAYCIVKCLCQEAEIEDYFINEGEEKCIIMLWLKIILVMQENN